VICACPTRVGVIEAIPQVSLRGRQVTVLGAAEDVTFLAPTLTGRCRLIERPLAEGRTAAASPGAVRGKLV